MGKSADKVKYKRNGKTSAIVIVMVAVIVLLVFFIFFGTTLSDWIRNLKAAAKQGESSSLPTSSASVSENGGAGQTTGSADTEGFVKNEKKLSPDYQLGGPKKGEPTATVTTSLGVMKFRLFPNTAPKSVANFTAKAKEGYYDNTKFPVTYENQAIQSEGDAETIYGHYFESEFSINLHNYHGALGVCNAGNFDTNTNQFYIITAGKVADGTIAAMSGEKAQAAGFGFTPDVINAYKEYGGDPTLDGSFGVFGQIYEGYDVLDAIGKVPPDENQTPSQEIKILSVEIGTY